MANVFDDALCTRCAVYHHQHHHGESRTAEKHVASVDPAVVDDSPSRVIRLSDGWLNPSLSRRRPYPRHVRPADIVLPSSSISHENIYRQRPYARPPHAVLILISYLSRLVPFLGNCPASPRVVLCCCPFETEVLYLGVRLGRGGNPILPQGTKQRGNQRIEMNGSALNGKRPEPTCFRIQQIHSKRFPVRARIIRIRCPIVERGAWEARLSN